MSDYLSDNEQVAALKKAWDDYGVPVLVGVALVVAGAVGWRWYEDYRQARHEAASAAYQRYVEQRREGAEELDAMAGTVVAEHQGSGYATLVLLYQAADAVAAEDLEKAEELLAEAVAGADAQLVDVARVRLARVLVQLERPDDALTVLGAVKGQGYRSVVAELKGDILMARGDLTGARDAYQAAVDAVDANQARPILRMKLNNVANLAGA